MYKKEKEKETFEKLQKRHSEGNEDQEYSIKKTEKMTRNKEKRNYST